MFKKIEIWILYLTLLGSLIFAIFFGVLVRQELVGSTKFGLISKGALFLAEIPKNLKDIFINDSALPTDRLNHTDFRFKGIPNQEERYMLLSRFDGKIQQGIVELIDLTNFETLHVWNPDFDDFNADINTTGFAHLKNLYRDFNEGRARLFHPFFLENGDLIFIYPLRKIDSCSNLVFQNFETVFHHSIEMDHQGNFWIPSRIFPSSLENIFGPEHYVDGGFNDDAITKISPDGEIIFKKSVAEIFIENNMEHLLYSSSDKFKNNPIHLNDIQPVTLDGNFYKKGDIFISLRHQSMILLYRPSLNKILWHSSGMFFFQHDVDILDANSISIFNNNAKPFFNGVRVDGHNEVLIYDFNEDKYNSYLKNSLSINDVRTVTGGLNTILPNNDLFIEESDFGRFLYFNSDGSLRWTFINQYEGQIFRVAWSRVIFREDEIKMVRNFLSTKKDCE